MLGATYKRHATLIRPIFRHAKVISYHDLIVDSVDQLLTKWRRSPVEKLHLDIVQQCQNLLLQIFGFIALDYDLEAVDNDNIKNNNELVNAIRIILEVTVTVLQLPNFLGRIYLKVNSKYRKAQSIIERYSNQIIEHELTQTSDSIAQRKRSSFIAALVSSLQQDEKSEAMKTDEEKTGQFRNLSNMTYEMRILSEI